MSEKNWTTLRRRRGDLMFLRGESDFSVAQALTGKQLLDVKVELTPEQWREMDCPDRVLVKIEAVEGEEHTSAGAGCHAPRGGIAYVTPPEPQYDPLTGADRD